MNIPPPAPQRNWRTQLARVLVVPSLVLIPFSHAWSANIAPEGTGIFGFNDAVDGDAGEAYIHTGVEVSRLNNGDFTQPADNWKGDAGGDGGLNISYAGILWPALRTDRLTNVKVTFATFSDGGWFGPAGLAGMPSGGTLTAPYLIEPVLQVTSDAGVTWTNVAFTSNYLASLTDHQIGGALVNPTSRSAVFTLTGNVTNIDGIRVIGENGGTSDNGFLGVFELEIESIQSDSDGDGMDDAWETANGLNVGLNDAASDVEPDGLTNLVEFQLQTNPQDPDTDADGLTDGAEVTTHTTDPKAADTDADGLNDGVEVNTTLTNPKVADTDGDGLSDGAEVNTHLTNPLVADTDGDGYSDAVEVRLFSNPTVTTSVPSNIAPAGTAIIGTSTAIEAGVDTPHVSAGTAAAVNDALPTTRVDTFGRTDPFSYVGITWATPRTVAVDRLELTSALFRDGGWFGPNNTTPGPAGTLDAALHLTTPTVQVTTDGTTWTTVSSSSNYLALLNGAVLPDLGAIPLYRSAFQLAVPQTGITGIRLIGPEGGDASGGFLGVWELTVSEVDTSPNPNIAPLGTAFVGTSTALLAGTDTPFTQQGTPQLLNDGQFGASIDTFSRTDPFAYASIIWPAVRTVPIDRVEVTFRTFGDGGWFGPNNSSAAGGVLAHPADPAILEEPQIQVTTDGGATWTVEPHSSTYLTSMNGFPVPGGPSPTVVFALNTPRAGINGIRLIGSEGGTGSGGFIALYEMAVREAPATTPVNVALGATGVIGLNDAIDGDPGRPFAASGLPRHVNDGDPGSRVDTFDGSGGTETGNFASLFWPTGRPVNLQSLTLTMATFGDGGWFGPPGESPAPGGALTPVPYLTEPVIQVLDASGVWNNVTATSDYLTAFNGHGIGGGANPNPTSATAVFTLNPPQPGVIGARLIGTGGGTSSGGFIGVFELAAAGTQTDNTDTDGDGQSDNAEAIAGTNPNDPTSVLAITGITRTGGSVTLVWNSVPGKTYQVQQHGDLAPAPWTDTGTTVGAASGPAVSTTTVVTLASPAPGRQFFRIKVVP